MNHRSTHQAVAASLAVITTLAMLLSVQGLADQSHASADAVLASASAPTAQVVVIVGKRIARG